jgi:hypothetical protein
MTVRFDHRKGSDLSLTFQVTEDGDVVDPSAWTVTCTMRDRYGLVASALTVATSTTAITLTATDTLTNTWPPGTLTGKLVIVEGSTTLSSESFELEILP